MTQDEWTNFDRQRHGRVYRFKINIFGLRHLWNKWRNRHHTEQDRMDHGIDKECQNEEALAEWLSRKASPNPMTHDELVDRLRAEIRSRGNKCPSD